MTIDLDSTICEVHGKQKQGAAYGYTKVLGYHPLLATRADTGEVLHARLRKGSPSGARNRFVEELIARVRRAGATGALTSCGPTRGSGPTRSSTPSPGSACTGRSRCAPQRPDPGRSPRSTTTRGHDRLHPTAARPRSPRRLVTGARSTRRECGSSCAAPASPTPAQARLWPDWRHHAFITDLDVDRRRRRPVPPRPRTRRARHPRPQRRRRARALPVRPVLRQRRLARLRGARPQPHPLDRPPRRRAPRRATHRRPHRPHPLIALPGRLVNRSGRHALRLPARWPWADDVQHRARPAPRPADARLTLRPRGP